MLETVKNSKARRTDMSNLRLVTKMAYPLGADAENKLVHERGQLILWSWDQSSVAKNEIIIYNKEMIKVD